MRGLENKVVLVAGAAGGIGAATATRLAEEGAHVVVADINRDGADKQAAAINSHGGTAIALQYDQSDEASIVDLVKRTVDHFGSLHGLHANAADIRTEVLENDRSVDAMIAASWEHTIRVNVIGYGLLIREALPHMLNAGAGSIVLTSSASSHYIDPGAQFPAYASSKAAVDALCRHTASLCGRRGIRCNAVAPGAVLTEALRAAQTQETVDTFLAATRSNRLGKPEDIANTVTFLLSDDASWVNGQVWSVNGGLTFRG